MPEIGERSEKSDSQKIKTINPDLSKDNHAPNDVNLHLATSGEKSPEDPQSVDKKYEGSLSELLDLYTNNIDNWNQKHFSIGQPKHDYKPITLPSQMLFRPQKRSVLDEIDQVEEFKLRDLIKDIDNLKINQNKLEDLVVKNTTSPLEQNGDLPQGYYQKGNVTVLEEELNSHAMTTEMLLKRSE